MKKNDINPLDELDGHLEKLSSKHIILVSLVVVLLIGLLGYRFVLPLNQKKIQSYQGKLTTLERTNKDFKQAVQDNNAEKNMLKEVERNNDNIKDEIEKKKKTLKYIENKIRKQHNINYSDEQWGIFFKTIQEKAIKYKLKILEINNEEKGIEKNVSIDPSLQKIENINKKEVEKSFRPIFVVDLKAKVDFKNLLDFLVDIEKNKLITNTHSLKIESYDDKTLIANIKINLWGVK